MAKQLNLFPRKFPYLEPARISELFWAGNASGWIIILFFVVLATWAVLHTPSPGISIGLLATAAGIMSVRPDMKLGEKLAWVVLLIVFVCVEIHAIHNSDKENQDRQSTQNETFKGIAQGIKDSNIQSQQEFAATMNTYLLQEAKRQKDFELSMSKSDMIQKLTTQSLEAAGNTIKSITGGDSLPT